MNLMGKMYGKNINFLIGSGASVGAIPTLKTNWIENGNEELTVEDILERYKDDNEVLDLVYSYYYHQIIKNCFLEKLNRAEQKVFNNYKTFLEKILFFLQREGYQKPRRINIFTTNYDLFFEKAADELTGKVEFYFNDGSSGNITKKLSMKNYHKKILHTGIFDNFDREIPIINLFKIHGSISWNYNDNRDEIFMTYSKKEKYVSESMFKNLEIISLNSDIKEKYDSEIAGIRYELRKNLAIIFPEKNKFEETLYQEFYYQHLRQLSYELEKNDSILIVFGFSFADEHIASLVNRALNNPTLKIYIFCYQDSQEKELLKNLKISKSEKIEFIKPQDDGKIGFDNFIEKLFGSDKNE